MRRRDRLVVAILIGLTSTIVSYLLLHRHGFGAGDFTPALDSARALLHGIDPYTNPAFGIGKPYPHDVPLLYPMPALLIAVPFTIFSPYVAGALFFGIGSGALAFGITRDGYARLPLFLSAPFFVAAYVAQWSPLIMAAFLIPWILPLAFAKPNLGIALGVAYPSIRVFAAAAVVYALSLFILPKWPLEWLHNLGYSHHLPPIMVLPGFVLSHHLSLVLILPGIVLLYSAVAWRRSSGRLLLMMILIPQLSFFYDQLPLWLIPSSLLQSVFLTVSSWIGFGGWVVFDKALLPDAGPWIILSIFLPALALVLWQQWSANRSAIPDIEPVPAMAGAQITGSH